MQYDLARLTYSLCSYDSWDMRYVQYAIWVMQLVLFAY